MNIRKAGYICATIAQFVGAGIMGLSMQMNVVEPFKFSCGLLVLVWGLWRTGFLTGRDVK